jgi:hypothetical protein
LFYDDCWEVFQQVDTDMDNSIDRNEFASLMLEGFGLDYDLVWYNSLPPLALTTSDVGR